MPAATVHVCQGGCGVFEEDFSKMHVRGFVNEKAYCAKCVVVVDSYLEMRDALHTNISEQWSDGLASLQKDFFERVKNLPDGG